jgi:hypothetical protein
MPRRNYQPRIYVCNQGTTKICQNGFSTMSGLTRHRNAAHPPPNNHIPPPPFSPMRSPSASPPPHDIDDNFGGLDINSHDNDDHHGGTLPVDDGRSSPGPQQAIQDGARILRHPILDGKSLIARYFILSLTESYLGTPCDSLGNDLPPNTPPPPYTSPENGGATCNEWNPFNNRAQFEIADFLYRRNQMSGVQIDELFDLWAACGDNGTEPPFASHNDLYETIDSIPLGDLPWICFTVKYNGHLPDGEPPTWMTTEYEVWCRDVRLLMRGQLANPDFNGQTDYTPLQTFGPTGKREWSNVMTGNWAWKQAVSYFENHVLCEFTYAYF